MVARFCAVWLVVLPFTAPFAAIDLSNFSGGGNAQKLIDTVAAPPSPTAQDDADDAAWSQRSDLLHPTGLCGLTPATSSDVASVPAILSPETSTPAAHSGSARTTILRL
jgi:hypothetical protein